MSHTPTPWSEGWDGSIRDANHNCIPLYSGFIAEAFYGEEPAISNAAFIVTAVNAYDKHRALIETLKTALECLCGIGDEHEGKHWSARSLAAVAALEAAKKEGF